MKKEITLNLNGVPTAMCVRLDQYANGGTALFLECIDGEPYSDITAWTDGTRHLPDNQFFVRYYNQRRPLCDALVDAGVFALIQEIPPTNSGYVLLPCYELKDPDLLRMLTDAVKPAEPPKLNAKKIAWLLKVIEAADVIEVADSPLLHSCDVTELNGEPDNQVLRFTWTDGEHDFAIYITEEGLANAKVSVNLIELEDHEGEPTTIKLSSLTPVHIGAEPL